MSGSDKNRSIGQIISDATDEELKDYHKDSGEAFTPDKLRAMAVRSKKRKKRHMRQLAGAAAVFILVAAGGIMAFNTFTTDVDADKNAKEEIITEDGVVIEDGGWGSSSEDNWVITDWEEVKVAKAMIPELIVPEYIPEGYEFESLLVSGIEGMISVDYLFLSKDKKELKIQQYIHNEQLEATHVSDVDRILEYSKGEIYIKTVPEGNNAIMQIDDGTIVYIWTALGDSHIIKIVENINY